MSTASIVKTSRSETGFGSSGLGLMEYSSWASEHISVEQMRTALFAAAAEMNRSNPPSYPLALFVRIFVMLQVVCSSYFVFDRADEMPEGFLTFLRVIYFGMIGDSNTFVPFFMIMLALDIVTIALLIAILVGHTYSREFKHWQLLFMRCWHSMLALTTFIPNGMLGFLSITYYATNGTAGSVVIMGCGIVCLLGSYVYGTTICTMFRQSPFLFGRGVAQGDMESYFAFLFLYSVPIGLGGAFQKSGMEWESVVAPLCLIGVGLYAVWTVCDFPYLGMSDNCSAAAVATAAVAGSLVSVIREAGVNIPGVVHLVVPWVTMVLSWIMYMVVFSRRRKRIEKLLTYADAFPEGGMPSMEEKAEYVASLGIKTRSQANRFIRIGIEGACDLFLDWSLVKHIASLFPDDDYVITNVLMAVTFFPSESLVLRDMIGRSAMMSAPSLTNQALLYQLHRVHVFRQMSASKECVSDFTRIQGMTEECIFVYSQFWRDMAAQPDEITPSRYTIMSQTMEKVTAAWTDILDKYPNNVSFLEEYATYLLEVHRDFRNAVRWHQKAVSIENGARILNDRMFRSFAAYFPFYLKNGIVDATGKLKSMVQTGGAFTNTTGDGGQSFADQMNATENDGSSGDIDVYEGEVYVNQLELKLAMQDAVQRLNSPLIGSLKIAAIIRFVVTLVYLSAVVVILSGLFNSNEKLFFNLTQLNEIEEAFCMIIPRIPMIWSGAVSGAGFSATWTSGSVSEAQMVRSLSHTGLHSLDTLWMELYATSHMEQHGTTDLLDLISLIPITNVACDEDNNLIGTTASSTMDNMIRSYFTTAMRLMLDTDTERESWSTSATMCQAVTRAIATSQILKLVPTMIIPNVDLSSGTMEHDVRFGVPVVDITAYSPLDNGYDTTDFLISFTPALMFFLGVPYMLMYFSKMRAEKERYSKVLFATSEQERIVASQRIRGEEPEKSVHLNSTSEDKRMMIFMWVLSGFCVLALISLLLVQLTTAQATSGNVFSLIQQYVLFGETRNALFDAASQTLLMVLLKVSPSGKDPPNFWTYQDCEERINVNIKEIADISSMLDIGFDGGQSVIGFDDELDQLRFREHCMSDGANVGSDGYWPCLSFDRLLSYLIDIVKSVLVSVDNLDVLGEETTTLFEIVDTRLPTGFAELSAKYEELMYSMISNSHIIVYSCFAACCLAALVIIAIELQLVRGIERELDSFRAVLRRLGPLAIAGIPRIMDLLLGKRKSTKVGLASASQVVFQTTSDAIIALDSDGIIETTNAAATSIFGFTSEQMLGQNIQLIISQGGSEQGQLPYTMKLMKNGQCSLIYEVNLTGRRNDDVTIPIKAVLLGISSNDRGADSFALVLRDMSCERDEEKSVDVVKRRVEQLLLHVLPGQMSSKVESGETAFMVERASVSIFDIAQFSTYMKSIPARDALDNLGRIITAFDNIARVFASCCRIKVAGDTYIIAAGLFATEYERSGATGDAVNHAVRCLDVFEELNIQMNTSLSLRIGIHTGGPLFAGVIGETNMFELVGTPLVAASQLQGTCLPGTVHVSETTYSVISATMFSIEEHSEQVLAGVGKCATYTVMPRQHKTMPSVGSDFNMGSFRNGGGYQVPSLDCLVNSDLPSFGDNAILEPPSLEALISGACDPGPDPFFAAPGM